MRHRIRIWLFALGVLILQGCSVAPKVSVSESLGPEYPLVELEDTVFHPQELFQCGPAALATVLHSSGVQVEPDQLTPQVYLPERMGSLQLELLGATRRHERMPYIIPGTLENLAAQLADGRPVLVLQNVGYKRVPVWHYAVVIGIDPAADEVILRSGTEHRLVMSAGEFLQTWDRGGNWAVVTLRPGEMPAMPDVGRYLIAAAGMESTGKTAAAEAAYRSAVEYWPETPEATLGLANTLQAQDEFDEAEQMYRRTLSLQPDNLVALNNLGLLLARQGCRDSGLQLVDRALKLDNGALEESLQDTREEILGLPNRTPGSSCSVLEVDVQGAGSSVGRL